MTNRCHGERLPSSPRCTGVVWNLLGKGSQRRHCVAHAFSNFWTDKAYRIPNGPNGTESPKNLAKDTVPINRFNVRSIFVRPDPMKSCIPECRLKLRALLSTPVTGLGEWRCRRMGEAPGQMLDWTRKLESTRGDAGGHPGHQQNRGNID